MKLLAAGRASEIYDLGNGRVLRRFKDVGEVAREALVMQHALAHGYPLPRVLDVQDDALVLERITGPSMFEDLLHRPWRLRAHARTLVELHRRLHKIPAPEGLAAVGPGDRLLHLDLHPLNVLLSPTGPVLIDWTNARRGEPALDEAMTWVLGTTAEIGHPLARAAARALTRSFASAVGGGFREAVPDALRLRLRDPRLLDPERQRLEGLLIRLERV